MKTLAILLLLTGSALAQAPMPAGGPPPGAAPGGPQGGPPGGMPAPKTSADIAYDAAIDVKDGQVVATKHAAVLKPGHAGKDGALAGAEVKSSVTHANGLYVHGHAPFTLADSRITLGGGGLSDFDGIAAGALVRDDATMVLRDVHITTNGIVSSAAVATDKTVMKVYHSTLVANGGPAPSAYVRRIGPGMMEPPTPLGIVGTARATLTMGEARSYFYDSTIVAQGWGALSTDAARGAYLEANRCDIRVLTSGYGAYADNGATVVINDSKMDVATFLGIIAGQASMSFNDVHAVSRGNAVMIHSVMGMPSDLATLAIRGGDIATTNAAILVKSANADITIEHAKIASRNGDLLLAENNDDSHATAVNGQKVHGVHAAIRGSSLKGNVINVDSERALSLDLQATQLQGAIRNASVSLDKASRWTATADSQVVFAGPVGVEQLDAVAGATIHARASEGGPARGRLTLPSGGTLDID
jgi:hypothetical protein